ncbi:rho guanine nucleotide exchange factor 16 [Lynx canadensis]|uniref:rho guanine nucleotide exchange factor 16 n=1 Tax=Lynx canadensis TaxID=61383 RepID=UPI0011AFE648|nr:rho guanine nucleotide exchange factor 16 [Lynx canadensis]
MSQRHSDSSLEEKLLEYRFHSELRLDARGNPASGLPMVRGALQLRDNEGFQLDTLVPPAVSPKDEEPRAVVLSTQSPAALKMGTQQLIPRSLAVSSKAKTPARHQSFGAAVLSKEAARRDPRLLSAPSFSLDDMDVDAGPGGALRRNLRNRSYRAAMKGLEAPGGERGPLQLSPKLQALAEEPSQPPARCPAKNKRTLGRKRAHKGSFKDDPRFYQEIRERGHGDAKAHRLEDSFVVQDYAQVDHIRVQKTEASDPSLLGGGGSRGSSVPHPFQVTLLHNSEGRQEKILLSSDSASDRARWIVALTHKERQSPANKGDLPQVEVTKAYLAKQADEITLQQADVVLVLEQEDGWFYGERLRDGETGWFPEDFARCITSRVAVEGNVRRMERLRVETDV